jgi:hypothetical protein
MIFKLFRRRIRHPLFPDLAADLAVQARGRSMALAGSFADLARAAARGAEARFAVYVLTSEVEPLSAAERDELWRLFQVPVYALLERGGRVTAWECEAQNGLHIVEDCKDREGGKGGACVCGRPGAMMTPVKTLAHAPD